MQKKIKIFGKYKIAFFSFIIAFLLTGFLTGTVRAEPGSANLFLSPSSGSYQAGSTFSVNLAVKSEQTAINAAEASLKFDPALIRVRSISKANSIFTLWPTEPSFSNTAGTISLTGGSPTPFRGANGRIVTITFEALREGTAAISFTQGRVLASDGAGTDITGSFSGGTYTITAASSLPDPSPLPTSAQTPAAPQISSPTHPDSEAWYSNNSPLFSWTAPAGITSARLILSESANAQPNRTQDISVSFYQVEDVADGVWYFSIQFQNQNGWGEIGLFKIQIDTELPQSFEVEADNEGDPTNPRPILFFETTDEPSGIDYYEIILNEEPYIRVRPEEIDDGSFRLPALPPGNYALSVKAVDKAGNFTLSEYAPSIISPFETLAALYLSVEPIPFAVGEIPSKLSVREPLIIVGKTLPEIIVRLYLEKEEGEQLVKEVSSNEEGDFKFEEFLEEGKYSVWLQAEDQRGALSEKTGEQALEISGQQWIFFLLIILIILIIISFIFIWRIWRQIAREKQKIKEEEKRKKIAVKQRAYNLLREKISEQIANLEEKVDLSRSEVRLLTTLKQALKEAEEEQQKHSENEK